LNQKEKGILKEGQSHFPALKILIERLSCPLQCRNKIKNKIKIAKSKMKQHGEFQKNEFFVIKMKKACQKNSKQL